MVGVLGLLVWGIRDDRSIRDYVDCLLVGVRY